MIAHEVIGHGLKYKCAVLAGSISTVLGLFPVWVYLLGIDHVFPLLGAPWLIAVQWAGSLVFGLVDLVLVAILRIYGERGLIVPLLLCMPSLGVFILSCIGVAAFPSMRF
jgi:hypothetical protein